MSHPRILGVAGGGLDDAAGWAKNAVVARVGREGEERTALLLNRLAALDGGVTVLHDLRIPIPGFSANIDHVVVSGQTVHIIDTKKWKPAFYWTLGGKTRRGASRFEAADKKTMSMAHEHIVRFLAGRGVVAEVATPIVTVWPSSSRGSLSVGFLRIPGAKAMTGAAFTSYAQARFTPSRAPLRRGSRPADPSIVIALMALLNNQPQAPRPVVPAGPDLW